MERDQRQVGTALRHGLKASWCRTGWLFGKLSHDTKHETGRLAPRDCRKRSILV